MITDDLLAGTGWVGEHPLTGVDVAHLLIYPATMFDPEAGSKLARLARLWGLVDATGTVGTPTSATAVDLPGRVLRAPGLDIPLPALNVGWLAAAAARGFVILSLTSTPLCAPSLDVIDDLIDHLRPGVMWLGLAPLTTEEN